MHIEKIIEKFSLVIPDNLDHEEQYKWIENSTFHIDDFLFSQDKKIVGIISFHNIKNNVFTVEFFNGENKKLDLSFENLVSNYEILKKSSDLNINDKVRLNHLFFNKDTLFSPFDTDGTIVDMDGYWVYVEWDNGFFNTYRYLDADLILKL